jgi:hypothetical protein
LDKAKAALSGKCISMSAYIKRTERSQWLNATSQSPSEIRTSKSQNKEKERNNKLRAEINEIEKTTRTTTTNRTKTQWNKKLVLWKS